MTSSQAPSPCGDADAQRGGARAVRRLAARETFGPWRAELAAQRTAHRDLLVLAGRHNLARMRRLTLEAQAEAPSGGRLPPAFPRPDLDELARRIEALAPQMPGRGRIALAFMPPEVKAEARAVADWVLQRPALDAALAGLERATRDLTGLYSGQPQAGDAAWQRACADVRDRVAQAVLRAAAQGRRDESRAQRQKAHQTRRGAAAVLRGAHGVLERERRRAEARAELAGMSAAQRAEERGRRERAAELGLER
jgi:hypothetical protein